MKYILLKLCIGLLFALFVLTVHRNLTRYVATGSELLKNVRFENQLADWQVSGAPEAFKVENSGIRIINQDAGKSLTLSQAIAWPPEADSLTLAADLRSENILPGERSWYLGRLVMARYDEQGRWLNLPHYVAALKGTISWRRYTETFPSDSRTATTRVLLQLPHATGALWLKTPSLRAAVNNPQFRYGQWLVFGLGGFYLLWLVRPYLKAKGPRLLRLGLVLAVVILLCGTLMPGQTKQTMVNQAHELVGELQRLGPQNALDLSLPPVGEWGIDSSTLFHLTIFLLLGLILYLLGEAAGAVLLDGFLLAGTTELFQLFIVGRKALLGDVLIDVSGVLVGLVAGVALLWLYRQGGFRWFGSDAA